MQGCEAGMHRGCFSGILVISLIVLWPQSGFGQKINGALQEKAKSGDINAMLKLAHAYEEGAGTEADAAQEATWYEHAANAGDPMGPDKARFALSSRHWSSQGFR